MSINASTAQLVESLPVALLEQTPGLPPPPGQESNFVDPPDLVTAVAVVISISSFLMVAAVGLRIYSKISSTRTFTWDDCTCFIATAGSLAYSAVTINGSVYHATGIHQWNVPVSTLISSVYLQEVLFFTAAYTPVVLMAKLSLFILYLRLFAVRKSVKILAWIGIVTCSIFYTFGMIFPLATCSPWPGESRLVAFASDRCAREKTYGYVTTAFNVLSDFYLVVIPIPVVKNLNMSTHKKIRVCSVFMLGILGCVCGVINSYYRVVLALTEDTTYYTAAVLLASIVEINVGIIVGCMPVIQSTILNRFAKAWHFSSVQSLLSRLSPKSKASDGNRAVTNSDQFQNDKQNGKPHLETEILHGADGKGKFMATVDDPTSTQRSWVQRSRSILETWTGGWNKGRNTTTGPAPAESSIMMTTSISSDITSGSSANRDLYKHYMLQAERTQNMV